MNCPKCGTTLENEQERWFPGGSQPGSFLVHHTTERCLTAQLTQTKTENERLRQALHDIRWMSGPNTSSRARDIAKHALYPTPSTDSS